MVEARDPRRREGFGGINWGAAFFGWLIAVAIGALLTAFLAAAGVAVGFGEVEIGDVEVENGGELAIGGAILLVLVAVIAYFAGGYVAGRMSHFDGTMQGVGVWLWAVIAAIVLAILGWVADQEYNLLAQLDLPRIPADETTTGLGVATLVVIVLGSLLAAMAGGRAGVGYHDRHDAGAVAPARDRAPADRPADRPPEDRPPT